MRKESANKRTNVQCIEVLVPRNFIMNNGHHLFRTLSLYSLHNHPVKNNPAKHQSEKFHFMVFDWTRTLKKLLEDRQIHYTIVQYFSPDTIYYNTIVEELSEATGSFGLLGKIREAEEVVAQVELEETIV